MKKENPFVIVLGIVQDGGYPHAGCFKECCFKAYNNPSLKKHVSCIAIVDPMSKEKWLIDATPDITEQLYMLNEIQPGSINGIFLTHAHIGHYTGLLHFGKEVMNSKNLPVYAAPLLKKFLSTNQPWKKLTSQKNIKMVQLKKTRPLILNSRLLLTPFPVPHRDELSETMGFRIEGKNNSAVYIPDIDSWKKWDTKLEDVIRNNGVVYIDGTFYDKNEIPKRNIKNIPHPFISETIEMLNYLPLNEKNKIHFIHLNHTNPALDPESKERKNIINKGFKIAEELSRFSL
jgi:pyrroloquinoline quinone biosynthesis protein B